MKRLNYLATVLLSILVSMSFTSCSDDDNNQIGNGETIKDVHFDIWASIGENSGMGSTSTILVKNVNSLEGNDTIGFSNDGVDVTAKMFQESAISGKYYYQIPKEKDRFGKYQIVNNKLVTVAERPFANNTYSDRRYTTAWINSSQFVVMAANGDKNDVIWTKLNSDNMTIAAEGSLNLPKFTPSVGTYSTSGIAKFRVADSKLIYLYCDKGKKSKKRVYAAFINPLTMVVENVDSTEVAAEMSGTAYGELLQSKTFFDEKGNLYVALNSQIPGGESSTCAYSRIVRINRGESKFDKSYIGFNNGENTGKIVTCEYMGDNKAILYIQNPEHTGTSGDNKLKNGWGNNYNCHYAMYDLEANKLTEFMYENKPLPYCNGTFSQRSCVLGNKVFIGVNPEKENACVYIYDIKKGEMKRGITIATGYEFSRLVHIAD